MLIKRDHGRICNLEKAATQESGVTAMELLSDMPFATRNKALKLLYAFFERDKFSAASPSGLRFVFGLLMVLPDNKIVEDHHQRLRMAAKAKANKKLSCVTIQDPCDARVACFVLFVDCLCVLPSKIRTAS
jgi:hypothetical protein